MIYFDYNATAPYSKSVREYIQNSMINDWANPSSEHELGAALGDEIKLIRSKIADILGCSSKSLIFTSGATESINSVLSEDNLKNNGVTRIISSPMEHHATLDRLKNLASKGWRVDFVENDRNGVIDLNHLSELMRIEGRALLTILYANNETGVINPVKEFQQMTHKNGHLIHVDAVQALGKIQFKLEDLNVDFASLSGHKIGALKGIGCLYVSDIRNYKPLLHGGGQERGYRPGTLNFSAYKTFLLALEDINFSDVSRMLNLRKSFEKKLEELGCSINCKESPRLLNTISVLFPGKSARAILANLSRKKVFVSTGSACSSGSFEPSHVIKSLGMSRSEAESCIRVSFGFDTLESTIELFIKHVVD